MVGSDGFGGDGHGDVRAVDAEDCFGTRASAGADAVKSAMRTGPAVKSQGWEVQIWPGCWRTSRGIIGGKESMVVGNVNADVGAVSWTFSEERAAGSGQRQAPTRISTRMSVDTTTSLPIGLRLYIPR